MHTISKTGMQERIDKQHCVLDNNATLVFQAIRKVYELKANLLQICEQAKLVLVL